MYPPASNMAILRIYVGFQGGIHQHGRNFSTVDASTYFSAWCNAVDFTPFGLEITVEFLEGQFLPARWRPDIWVRVAHLDMHGLYRYSIIFSVDTFWHYGDRKSTFAFPLYSPLHSPEQL